MSISTQNLVKTTPASQDSQSSGNNNSNFILAVWFAFFDSLKVNQNTAQTDTNQLAATQTLEQNLNDTLAGYNYQSLPASLENSSSYTPQISDVMIENDQIQAQINLVQNNVGTVNQTAQMQQTTANTSIQNASQVLQQGFAVSNLIGTISQMICR